MMDVVKLYPQYNIIKDRRIQKDPVSPVAFERRSGKDRRSDDRLRLDTNLTRDIFEVKNKVSQIQQSAQKTTQKILPQNTEKTNFTQNVSKAALGSIKADQFIKTNKPNSVENSKTFAKTKSDATAVAGIITAMLGGIMASTFLGPAGIGVAIGLGAYFGGKILKNAIVSHLKKNQ